MADKTSAEIRREIERTRHQMDETVEQIGEKLSAARILDEMWTRVRSGDGAALLGEAIRDHPRPFALMGLGIGLLAVEQARGHENGRGDGSDGGGHGHVGTGSTEPAEGRVGPYRGDAVDRDDPDWEYASTGTRVKSRVEDAASSLTHAAGTVKERAVHLKENAKHAAEERVADAKHRVAEAAHRAEARAAHARQEVAGRAEELAETARRGARQGAQRARAGFTTMLDENPMALGAIAFGLGIAAGLSAPSTRWEGERIGRTSKALKEEAGELITETARKVKQVAGDATNAAREELERQRTETGPIQVAMNQLRQSAKEIGQAAQEAARQRAESEELTVDGLKHRARRGTRRARERSGVDSNE